MTPNFERIAWNYWNNIEALGQLSLFLSPTYLQKRLNGLLDALLMVGTFTGLVPPEQADQIRSMKQIYNEWQETTQTGQAELIPTDRQEFEQRFHDQVAQEPKLPTAVYDLSLMTRMGGLLERSALIMLTSQFEVLLAEIFHEYYSAVPGALSGEEKALSINQLKEYGSIEEALRSVVSEKVNDLLKGDIDRWRKAIQAHFGFDLKQLYPGGWSDWAEVFQRRNLYVHNDGKVDRAYLLKTGRKDIHIGDQLEIDEEYLTGAIDSFGVAGVLLVDRCWLRLSKGQSSERDEILLKVVARAVETRKWLVCRAICESALQRKCASDGTRAVFQLQLWYAAKMAGNWSGVEAEVRSLDLASYPFPRVALCAAALLEDSVAFFSLLPRAVEDGVLEREIRTWPALEPMRSLPEFEEHIRELFDEPRLIRDREA